MDLPTYLGIPPERFQAMETHLRERAAALGLPLTEDRRAVNSHRALLLAEWARDHAPDRADLLHRTLFRLYFAEGRNLAAEEVLCTACEQAGIPAASALAGSREPAYEARLAASMQRARTDGVTGVPAFIINRRYRIDGAQPYEVLADVLRRIAAVSWG